MKTNLELNVTGKGTFINSWDTVHGNDICGLIRGDKIDVDGELLDFNEFIRRVLGNVCESDDDF